VHESFPAKTLNDFVAIAKNPKEPLAYASPGSGTAQHLGMELLRSKLKLNLNHIPYKGGAPAMNDLLAGHVKVMLAGMGDASPHFNTGRVFPLELQVKPAHLCSRIFPPFKNLAFWILTHQAGVDCMRQLERLPTSSTKLTKTWWLL
jgi:hypothetical protein